MDIFNLQLLAPPIKGEEFVFEDYNLGDCFEIIKIPPMGETEWLPGDIVYLTDSYKRSDGSNAMVLLPINCRSGYRTHRYLDGWLFRKVAKREPI